MSANTKAVGLPEAARRCGMSYITARRKVAAGTFPVPELPRRGRDWHRFAEADIDAYLKSSTADAKKGRAA